MKMFTMQTPYSGQEPPVQSGYPQQGYAQGSGYYSGTPYAPQNGYQAQNPYQQAGSVPGAPGYGYPGGQAPAGAGAADAVRYAGG